MCVCVCVLGRGGGCCLLVDGRGGSEMGREERGEHKTEAAGLPVDRVGVL